MSALQATPGPWEYSASDIERHAVVSPPVDSEADIGPWFTAIVSCGDDSIETANARLIAAAPDLYEAAYDFLAAWADGQTRESAAHLAIVLGRALAKARGEQSA